MSSDPAQAHMQPLGTMLVAAGLIGDADLERALTLRERIGGRLGSVLMRIGALSEDNLLIMLKQQLELPLMGETVPAPDEDAVRLAALASPVGLDWMLDQQVLVRSEEHTSELQSLMRISYAVFCLK